MSQMLDARIVFRLPIGFADIGRGQETPPGTLTVFPGDEWLRSSPTEEGVDATKLSAAVRLLESFSGRDGADELLVVRRGRVIHAGPSVDKVHGVWSCTKSFTSTTLGLLIDDGKCTLDTTVADSLHVEQCAATIGSSEKAKKIPGSTSRGPTHRLGLHQNRAGDAPAGRSDFASHSQEHPR